MANTSDPVSRKERRFGVLSLISLAGAVVGFVSALVPGANANHSPGAVAVDLGVISVALRIVFLLLAVLLGILGRRSRAGRFGLIGSGVLLMIFLVVTFFLVSRHRASVVRPPTVQLPQ
jgi:uncharacterized membrane protein YozB (DUF420 family)